MPNNEMTPENWHACVITTQKTLLLAMGDWLAYVKENEEGDIFHTLKFSKFSLISSYFVL